MQSSCKFATSLVNILRVAFSLYLCPKKNLSQNGIRSRSMCQFQIAALVECLLCLTKIAQKHS